MSGTITRALARDAVGAPFGTLHELAAAERDHRRRTARPLDPSLRTATLPVRRASSGVSAGSTTRTPLRDRSVCTERRDRLLATERDGQRPRAERAERAPKCHRGSTASTPRRTARFRIAEQVLVDASLGQQRPTSLIKRQHLVQGLVDGGPERSGAKQRPDRGELSVIDFDQTLRRVNRISRRSPEDSRPSAGFAGGW